MNNLIEILTPTIIAVTGTIGGCMIMVLGILTPLDDTRFNQLSNFATALISVSIGGASGIATQSRKSQIDEVNIDKVDVDRN